MLIEVQFLNVTEEAKIADIKPENVRVSTAEKQKWYDISMSFNKETAQRHWVNIRNASEVIPHGLEHGFQVVNLTRPVPFFGRYVHQVMLTTAGCILTMHAEDIMQLPSHIAPFLTTIEPSDRDLVLFEDNLHHGQDFLVQWERHFDGNDKHKLRFQVRIYLDGTVTFVYENLLTAARNRAAQTQYGSIVGLQDGFANYSKSTPKSTDVDVYLYPSALVQLDDLVDHAMAMVTFQPVSRGCAAVQPSQCSGECIRCGGSCQYSMELHRPDSPCYKKDECHNACPMIHAPVCGSDGISYSNKCQLQYTACVNKKEIHVVYEGNCPEPEQKPKKQEEEKCKSCPQFVDPVCGNDGKTYASKCIMEQTNCLQQDNVEVSFQGACPLKGFLDDDQDNDDDDDDDLEKVSEPVDTKKENGVDSCRKVCEETMKPVCLNGKKLFTNKCMMDIVVCQEHLVVESITEPHCNDKAKSDKSSSKKDGDDAKQDKQCSSQGCPRTDEPVCGSNKVTYHNKCILEKINCEQKVNIIVVHQGPCKGEQQPTALKACSATCTRELMLMCGTDGKTYNNKCLLEAAMCEDKTIALNHTGPCDGQRSFKAVAADLFASQKAREEEESHQTGYSGLGTGVGIAAILVVVVGIALGMFIKRSQRKAPVPTAPPTVYVYSDSGTTQQSVGYRRPKDTPPNANGGGTVQFKYDKLPLVPNMEQENNKRLPN